MPLGQLTLTTETSPFRCTSTSSLVGDRAHLPSAHLAQMAVLARAYLGGMTTGAPQREHGSVLGSVIRYASALELFIHGFVEHVGGRLASTR